MSRRATLLAFALTLLLLLSAGGRALAQEASAAHHADGASVAQETGVEPEGESGKSDFAGRVVNFLLLFGGLAFVARKPIAAFLKDQVRKVSTALVGSAERRREAQEKSEAARERLSAVAVEAQGLRTDARSAAERERERIDAQAREDGRRLRDAGAAEIEHNLQAELRELRGYSAARATALAAERLRARLTEADHRRLIDRAIERLGRAA